MNPIQPHDPTMGPLFEYAADQERLNKQLERIRDLMLDGKWRTVNEIIWELEKHYEGPFPAPSVQADLRHLRKPNFGGFTVSRRCRQGNLHEYLVHDSMCCCMYCATERERKAKRRAA